MSPPESTEAAAFDARAKRISEILQRYADRIIADADLFGDERNTFLRAVIRRLEAAI